MKILKAGTFGYYDIFVGDGWINHTRVQLKKNKQVSYVSGNVLESWKMRQLASILK